MAAHCPGGVIWDVDGTLVDTAEMHFQAWGRLCSELGRPFTRQDFAETFGRRNPEILWQILGEQFRPDETDALGDRKEEYYRSAVLLKGVSLLPGVRALLEALDQAGFRQAIGSSAPRQNVDLILARTSTRKFFHACVSMEDTSRGKPDPQVFLLAASVLGLAPGRCVVVEDAPAGVQAARAGGMACIAVRFVGHHSEERLQAAGANLVARTLEEVDIDTVVRFVDR